MTALPRALALSRDDRPIVIAALFLVAILIVGTIYTWARALYLSKNEISDVTPLAGLTCRRTWDK